MSRFGNWFFGRSTGPVQETEPKPDFEIMPTTVYPLGDNKYTIRTRVADNRRHGFMSRNFEETAYSRDEIAETKARCEERAAAYIQDVKDFILNRENGNG